jgi:hypothetical protein
MKNIAQKTTWAVLFIAFFTPLSISAQKIESPMFQTDSVVQDSTTKRWTGTCGLGLDLTAITLINPRLTDGEGRINAGGLFNFAFQYQSNRLLWANRGNIQLSLLRDGTEAWSKATDMAMWNTQIGIRLKGKWYAAAMVDVQTSMLNTYDNKFLRPQTEESKLTSKIFAPATLKFAPGLLWKPKPYFSMLIAAISNKNIIVTDPTLAAQVDSTGVTPVFGNEIGKQWSSQIGGELRMDLNLRFADDKVVLNSVLDLYSNYLKAPENIAIEWLTSVNFRSDWFYEHNTLVRIGFSDEDLGRRVSIRNTFLLKYMKNF